MFVLCFHACAFSCEGEHQLQPIFLIDCRGAGVVVDGDDERERIDKAVKTIDREILRKLEEFGYIDSEGNMIEPYVIPTMESVKKILGRDD